MFKKTGIVVATAAAALLLGAPLALASPLDLPGLGSAASATDQVADTGALSLVCGPVDAATGAVDQAAGATRSAGVGLAGLGGSGLAGGGLGGVVAPVSGIAGLGALCPAE